MKRLSHRDFEALCQCILTIYTQHDLTSFPTHVLQALRGIISAEHFFYAQVDFQTPHVSLAVVEPAAIHFPGDERFVVAQVIREHPVANHWYRTGDHQALKISDFLTQCQYHSLTLYQMCYRQMDTEYQLALGLPHAARGITGVVCNRLRRDFSERDRLCLNMLQPHLGQARQNAQAFTRLQQDVARLGQKNDEKERGVIVLREDGSPQCLARQTWEWVAEYFDAPPRQTNVLPDGLQRWIRHAQSFGTREGDVSAPRTPLRTARDGNRLTVRLIADHAGHQYLLLEEQPTAHTAAALASLGLTRRESEVLFWVAHGKTDRDVAAILTVSARTVQKHLERIYTKLGVENRTAAAGRALEALGLSRTPA